MQNFDHQEDEAVAQFFQALAEEARRRICLQQLAASLSILEPDSSQYWAGIEESAACRRFCFGLNAQGQAM